MAGLTGGKGWDPFEEIVEGRIRSDSFTVKLWSVHRGCPSGGWECVDERYRDPAKFFDRTYFSAGLSRVLEGVVSRLTRGEGDAVYLLHTGFGGGKSHTLVAIYHVARSPGAALGSPRLRRFLEERGLSLPSSMRAAVSVFDGAALDPVALARRYRAPNPWVFIVRELAAAAGQPDLAGWVEDYRDLAPGHDELSRFLAELESLDYRPVVLVDELAIYLRNLASAGRRGEADALRVFIHNLAVAASNSRYTVVAIATPQQYEPESRSLEAFLSDVQRVAAVGSIVAPVDAAEVLKNALLKRVDPAAALEAAERYMGEYRSRASRYPAEARTPGYAEAMRRSYPFHPLLVRELYENIAQLQGFQGTRDILRIAAWTLHYMASGGHQGGARDFILLGDVDVTRDRIRDLLKVDNPALKKLLESIVYDLEVVKRLDEEKVRRGLPRVASPVYSAILLRSISGRAMSQEEVMLGAASPLRGVSAEVVAITLDTLVKETAHLHKALRDGDTVYMVKASANIFTIVDRVAREILRRRQDMVREKLREHLRRLAASGEVRAVVWPEHPGSVDDIPEIKIVLLDPADDAVASDDEVRLLSLMNHYARYSRPGGTALRVHRNTLVFLVPRPEVYGELERLAARLLAVDKVMEEGSLYGLQAGDVNELRSMKSRDEEELREKAILLYDRVYYPTGSRPDGVMEFDSAELKASTVRREGRLWPAAAEALEAAGKLARRGISDELVYRLVERAYRNLRGQVHFTNVLGMLTGDPSMPMVLRAREALDGALRSLVAEGRLVAVHQGGGEVLCMKPPSKAEEYYYIPCTSQEAGEYCSVAKAPSGVVCRPRPPGDCSEPEWDEATRSWTCRQAPAMRGVHGSLALRGAEPPPAPARGLRRVTLTGATIAELVEALRKQVDPNARVLDAHIELALRVRQDSATPGLNLLLQALSEIGGKAGKSYAVEVRLLARAEGSDAWGSFDVTFTNIGRARSLMPALARLAASMAGEAEIVVQQSLRFKGGSPVSVDDLVAAFDRYRLQRYPGLVVRELNAAVEHS